MMSRRVTCLAAFALVVLAASPLFADDWRAWRGPLGTGISDEKGVPTTWSQTENVKWKVALDGPGNSTPIVVGQRVFITHSPAKSNSRGLRCYDRETGKLLWKHEVEYAEKELSHGTNPFCSSSPASDGERVIAWYGSAGLFCFDLEGRILWQKDLGKVEHIWGYGSSPVFYENLVIMNYGPGMNAFVVALDKRSGDEVWRREFPGQKSEKEEDYRGSWSTPVIHKFGEQTLLLLSLPGKLYAIDPLTSADVWSCDGLTKNLVYTSPLVAGDVVVAMCGYGGQAIAVRAGGQGDVTETHRLWAHPTNPQRVGSGVVAGDYVYILHESGQAWCLDSKTGEKKWDERLDGGGTWSSMCFVDGRLYVINTGGTTTVLEPSSEAMKVLGQNKLGETTRGSLAFSDGQIFIRTHGYLYCIEAAKAGP